MCEWWRICECDTLFKSKHREDGEAQHWWGGIDCDRLEETSTPFLSVLGFSQCSHKSTFIALALKSPQSAAYRPKQLSRDSLQQPHSEPSRYQSIIHHQSLRNKNREQGREAVSQLTTETEKSRFYLRTVHNLYSAVTFEERKEVKLCERLKNNLLCSIFPS